MAFRRTALPIVAAQSIFDRDYLVGDLATATGRPRSTVAAWVDRGLFAASPNPDDDVAQAGPWRRFSVLDVYAATVASAATPYGAPVAESTLAARAVLDELRRERGPIPADGRGFLCWLRGAVLHLQAVPLPHGGTAWGWALTPPSPAAPHVQIPLFEVLRAANARLANDATPSREDSDNAE